MGWVNGLKGTPRTRLDLRESRGNQSHDLRSYIQQPISLADLSICRSFHPSGQNPSNNLSSLRLLKINYKPNVSWHEVPRANMHLQFNVSLRVQFYCKSFEVHPVACLDM